MTTVLGIDPWLVHESRNLQAALETIDQNSQGVCFVVDDAGRLVGLLTDGDVRRAVLNGSDLKTKISTIMHRDFVKLPISSSPEKIRETLSDQIRVIPLVNEAGQIVDIANVRKSHLIPVMEPSLDGNEMNYVSECLRTGWISSQGPFVKKFEEDFAAYCGSSYSLAVSNGTVALHLALEALGIGEGDEVIVPDLTFAASANAVIHARATPVFVDVEPHTWTMDMKAVEAAITAKTKAIMPVHLYGHPCAMDELKSICDRRKIFMVEDCAEALGSFYKGKHVGTFGDVSTFSFFGNKTVTTGEGGMLIFKDEEVFRRAHQLRDHGMSKKKRYWHDVVGYNYRMTNVQAAIGVAQMEKVHLFVEAKRALAGEYTRMLSAIPGIDPAPEAKDWAKSSYWLYTCRVSETCALSRDDLQAALMNSGIETRPVFFPLHQMPPFQKYLKPGQSFPVTEKFSLQGLSFPSSPKLSRSEVEFIDRSLKSIFSKTAKTA